MMSITETKEVIQQVIDGDNSRLVGLVMNSTASNVEISLRRLGVASHLHDDISNIQNWGWQQYWRESDMQAPYKAAKYIEGLLNGSIQRVA